MRLERTLVLLVLLALAATAYALGLQHYLTLDALRDNRAALAQFVAAHGVASAAVFVLVYLLTVALSIPGATILTLAGGLLFGAVFGSVLSVIGATLGAAALFLAARTALGDLLRRKAGPWLTPMAEGFNRNAFNYLLFLRLVPVFPFWAVNLGAALLDMAFAPFLIATLLGIVPASAAYSSFGAGLGRAFDAGGAVTLSSVLSPQLIFGLVGLGLLALAPIVIGRLRKSS